MSEAYQLDIGAVMERLPHRYPFLLIDRVIECQAGERLRAIKNVTVSEPFFTGHFPTHPVMPGVLVIEAMAQAGGLLAWESASAAERDSLPYLVGIEKARFKQPIRPGDQLSIEVRLLAKRQTIWRFDCTTRVDDRLAVQAEILIASGKRK